MWFLFWKLGAIQMGGPLCPHKHVAIQAATFEEANSKAEDSGLIYFDGVEKGWDCECCGDSWWRQTELDEDEPYTLDEILKEFPNAHIIH